MDELMETQNRFYNIWHDDSLSPDEQAVAFEEWRRAYDSMPAYWTEWYAANNYLCALVPPRYYY